MDKVQPRTVALDVSEVGIDPERQVTRAVFCGIDPGREKCGIAVGSYGNLFFSAIIPYVKFDTALGYLFTGDPRELAEWKMEGDPYNFSELGGVFLGDGTFHGEYEKRLRAGKIDYALTDERMTTLEARALYWRLHPRRGLSRLIPIQWMVPSRPIDDLAAWAIMRRALASM